MSKSKISIRSSRRTDRIFTMRRTVVARGSSDRSSCADALSVLRVQCGMNLLVEANHVVGVEPRYDFPVTKAGSVRKA
jgi:hypothetical protein